MDVKKKIKSFLNQADIYKSQGLLREAKTVYMNAGKMIKENHKIISNYKSLLGAISKKIDVLNKEIHKVENEAPEMEMSEQVQEIIKTKFAFSDDKDTAQLEGAIALAKFGQYAKAIEEFKKLLKTKSTRVEAAKNIIRCHMGLETLKDAVKHYQHWVSNNIFSKDQLSGIRNLLQSILEKQGIDILLPIIEEDQESKVVAVQPDTCGINEEEILDISSVGITLTLGRDEGKTYEYDVSFQSGTVINLLITKQEKAMLEALEQGTVLEQVQFYSPIAMFEGCALVTAKSKIDSGPKEGHYSVDIKIQSI